MVHEVVRTLGLVLDLDERMKLYHGWRVAAICFGLADRLRLPDRDAVYVAGLLHDIGGIGMRDHIVHAVLAGCENAEVRSHPARGAEILSRMPFLAAAAPFILQHHERHDGRGYPSGLSGDEITPGGYVLGAADRLELRLRTVPPGEAREAALALANELSQGAASQPVAAALADLVRDDPRLIAALYSPADLADLLAGIEPELPPEAGPIEESVERLLWLFARVIDAKHSYTAGHSARVALLGAQLMSALGAGPTEARDALWAGFLHDMGKVGVPRALLNKEGGLDEQERAVVREHALVTFELLEGITELRHLAAAAAAHHERFDGSGYPRGLAGERIPILGRALAYADAFDALTSDRAYRQGLAPAEAIAVMRADVGRQFDPRLAETAFRVFGEAHEGVARTVAAGRWPPGPGPDGAIAPAWAPSERPSNSPYPVGKGVLLLGLEAWSSLGLGAQLEIVSGRAEFERLAEGVATDAFLEHLEPESRARAEQALRGLRPGETHTDYFSTTRGRPLELVFLSRPTGFEVLARKAENRLQTLENLVFFYRAFLGGPTAICFTDPAGTILDVNRGFLDLYGYRLSEVIGHTPRILKSGRQAPSTYVQLWKALTDSATGVWSGEVVNRRRDGLEVTVLLTAIAVRNGEGRLIGFVASALDITRRRQIELELAAKNEELESLNRLKSELMAITSHDLKAPVQAISSYAGLLGEQMASGRGDPREVLGRITGAAGRMASLIDSILDLEKINSGTLKPNLRRVHLDGILRTCVETHRALAGHRGVRIELVTPSSSRPTAGDLVKLEQLVNNLLSNAVKFSADGGLVEVDHAERDGNSVLTVSDRGPGIPEEDLQNVFDRYYQVKRPRATAVRAFGTSVGLGLAIARSIAEMHGGRIWAENRSGGGCRFTVMLPTRLPGITPLAALLIDPEGRLTPALQGPLIRREVDCFVAQQALEARRFYDCERPDLVFYDREALSTDLRALLDALRGSSAPPLVVAVAVGASGDADAGASPGERLLELPITESEVAELLRERQIGAGGA